MSNLILESMKKFVSNNKKDLLIEKFFKYNQYILNINDWYYKDNNDIKDYSDIQMFSIKKVKNISLLESLYLLKDLLNEDSFYGALIDNDILSLDKENYFYDTSSLI